MRFTETRPQNSVWKDEAALLQRCPVQCQPPDEDSKRVCCTWVTRWEILLVVFLLPVLQTPRGHEPCAAAAVPATLQWETWPQEGHQWPPACVARTAQSSTASTQSRTSSTTPPLAVGSPAVPSATPTSPITPTSLLTWQTISLQTPSPGGSLPKGCTEKKSDWTLKQSSTWPTSLLCSSHLARLPWCWKDPRIMGRPGGPTSISLSTVQLLLGSRMISLRKAPCAPPGIQMQCPAPEER